MKAGAGPARPIRLPLCMQGDNRVNENPVHTRDTVRNPARR